jgi:hypothetical protein
MRKMRQTNSAGTAQYLSGSAFLRRLPEIIRKTVFTRKNDLQFSIFNFKMAMRILTLEV